MRNVLLVWVIGLTLGIAAGAATAMLLMPQAARGAAQAAEQGAATESLISERSANS